MLTLGATPALAGPLDELAEPAESKVGDINDACTGSGQTLGAYRDCFGIHYGDNGEIDCIGHWKVYQGQEPTCSII